ncbi:hypothetical protein [Clostridium sp.]
MKEYKDFVALGLNMGAIDIIGDDGLIKADKIVRSAGDYVFKKK